MNLHRLRLLAEKANEEDDRWQQYSDHQMAILSKDTMADLAKVARESAPRHYHEGKDVPLSEEIRNYAEAASATVSVLKELHLID